MADQDKGRLKEGQGQESMNYRQAMEYIENRSGYGIVSGPDSIKELLNRLGNPQEQLKCIQITGTNGKGSAVAFLTSVLRAAGYRTGAFVSHAIFDYREKFQIQAKPISRALTAKLMETVAFQAKAMAEEGLGYPTPFEIETAMSFLLFREKKCDLVVLETGMGGERNVTNVIQEPLVCVFTPISMEHGNFGKEAIKEIAREKAGIMKAGVIAVSAPQQEAVMKALEEEVKRSGVKELRLVKKGEIKGKFRGLKSQSLSYGEYSQVELSLLGQYQLINAALVLEVVKVLESWGYSIKERALRKGMAEAVCPGRFQVLTARPVFVVDGAHNEAGAIELKKSLEFYFTNKRIIYIMGMLRDEEYDKVVAHTHFLAEHIITVAVRGNPRAMPALELAQLVSGYHSRVTAADSIEEAVELACLLADKDTVIVGFGSLAYLGDCIHAVLEREKRKKKE